MVRVPRREPEAARATKARLLGGAPPPPAAAERLAPLDSTVGTLWCGMVCCFGRSPWRPAGQAAARGREGVVGPRRADGGLAAPGVASLLNSGLWHA